MHTIIAKQTSLESLKKQFPPGTLIAINDFIYLIIGWNENSLIYDIEIITLRQDCELSSRDYYYMLIMNKISILC